MSQRKDVMVIGFDAMDPGLVREWAAQGLLPNFKSLFERSAWGLVKNPRGLEAGSAWPTFYNGVCLGAHGQLDGTRRFDPLSYEIVQYEPEDLTCERIWARLSRAGRKVCVIDAAYTYLTEGLNGVEVHDWGTHAAAEPGTLLQFKTWPPQLADDIEARFGLDPLGGDICDKWQPRTTKDIKAFTAKLIERVRKKRDMSSYLHGKDEWDFFMTTFSEAHCIGHHAWHIHDPERPDHDPAIAAAVGDPIKDVYIELDMAIGELVAMAGEATTLFVYCSHGMGPSISGSRLLDRMLVKFEGGATKDKDRGAAGVLRKGWRSLPPGIKRAMMPVQRKVWKSVVKSAFEGNRAGRASFEIYANDSTGGVRINLVGREAQGLVQPGREYDELCAQLTSDLLEVINLDTGLPLVKEVIKTHDAHPGQNVDNLPDLLVSWNKAATHGPILRVSSPKIGELVHDSHPPRTGDHLPDGMFVAAGPTVKPGHLNSGVDVIDMAPTFAALLGVSREGLDGHCVGSVFDLGETANSAREEQQNRVG